MGNHRGDFGLIINLKRPPLDEDICEELLKDIIRVVEKYKILDDLNFIEIFRMKSEPIKDIDA